MSAQDEQAMLLRYLQTTRDSLLWKLEGLTEYDVRRPMTPTGTNLLGLVKHCAGVEFGYFGRTFGRDPEDAPAWLDEFDDDPQIDLWVPASETRADIVGLFTASWKNTGAVVEELGLDAVGRVPWWSGERAVITVRQAIVHVSMDLTRHAGHADIIREGIDGAAGLRADNSNLSHDDPLKWQEYYDKVERAAREAKA
ncbi:DinB family protein [Streptosporangium vulgare]|uniref:DinB family protein n=1 Tax=Streptosporangium vulgare TaxID=46190 RepID=A0ABV5TFB3_9ACTN